MIHILGTLAISIFTLAGMTAGVMVGADALDSKGVPKAVGVGVLTFTALLFFITALWLGVEVL